MSIVQRDAKFLKNKLKNIEFFLSYLDVSKLRLLQMLNLEQEALRTLKYIKRTNIQFLNTLNENFFKNSLSVSYIKEEIEEEYIGEKEQIQWREVYFLVDSKDNNEYTDNMYKKMEETLSKKVREDDYVITFGEKVNIIAQKLELNILQHYPYEVYEDEPEFLEKVSTIIEIGLNNKIFTDASLLMVQQNKDNKKLLSQKLFPIQLEQETANEKIELKAILGQEDLTKDLSSAKQNFLPDYILFFNDINVKKINWYPNINFYRNKFLKSAIKQNAAEIKMKEKIHRLKLELQLLDEKKNKLEDEKGMFKRMLNRVVRENSTNASLILFAAFKMKNESQNDFDEPIRKKKKDDFTALLNLRKGGSK